MKPGLEEVIALWFKYHTVDSVKISEENQANYVILYAYFLLLNISNY